MQGKEVDVCKSVSSLKSVSKNHISVPAAKRKLLDLLALVLNLFGSRTALYGVTVRPLK